VENKDIVLTGNLLKRLMLDEVTDGGRGSCF